MNEPLDWSGPAPRSPRFDDIYFSPADGLAESRTVFLQGCGLPDSWAGRTCFTVGELGFGTGLNILALIDLWRQTRPDPAATLHIFSIEAYPMSRDDAARALAAWPELSHLVAPLLADWPGGRRGFHRIEWPDHGVILDLAILEAEAALESWSGRADAWFLDGFAPSKNPEMWRSDVLALLAARSAPGARAATFSVAGAVRRGLLDAGFEIERAPGFGRKKERLEARLSGPEVAAELPEKRPRPRIAVIGAGLAGAALQRAFARLGHKASVFDAKGVGAGASGNPSALVTPRFDAGLGPGAALYAQAFARAVQLYRQDIPAAIIATGALQLAVHPRDPARFDKIAPWEGFDPGAIQPMDQMAAADALDERSAASALHLRDALVVEPKPILDAWLTDGCVRVRIDRIVARDSIWRLLDDEGGVVTEADIVCIAAGPASTRLAAGVPLRPVRGQASFTDEIPFTGAPAAFSGYAIPIRNGVLFGATHDRDDWTTEVRPEDDARNLTALGDGRPALAARLKDAPLSGRASLRAMSPDHMPIAGAVPGSPGLFAMSGLGGRGFTLAPLLAEAVAAQALGAPSPLPSALTRLIDPARFDTS